MLERMITPLEPKQRVLNQLDREMQAILERQDLPDREKVTMYNQVLQRYLNYKNKDISPHPSPNQHASDTIESDILRSLPKVQYLRSKAINILERIKKDPNMTWNEKGEFVYRGETISRSNMIDLVNAMIRSRKSIKAHGWQQFARALQNINIPQEYINNPTVWSLMQRDQQSDDDFGTADESPPGTPQYPSSLRRSRAPERKRTRDPSPSPNKPKVIKWLELP